jgi:putative ATP-dependent endonuclease of OLD family
MRIRRLQVKNFRNFRSLDIEVGSHLVIVGENGVGKSNLLYALRLVLDPSLPDAYRQLRDEDFWDGLPRPLSKTQRIEISAELTDFQESDSQLADLADCLIEAKPMVARLTYVFRPKATATSTTKIQDYEFLVYGGNREDVRVTYEIRKRLPVDFFHALRDAESDLSSWRRSPLRPLLERAWSGVTDDEKTALKESVDGATATLTDIEAVAELGERLQTALKDLAGEANATDLGFGVGPTDVERLLRTVRLLLDGQNRGISDASLGMANLIYLTLKQLELRQLVDHGDRDHTFLAIEEPEAHLHPQVQRQVFRNFLRVKKQLPQGQADNPQVPATILLTTHSPNVASVAPLNTIVLLRKRLAEGTKAKHLETVGASAASAGLEDDVVADMERYIDATRAEILFAKGVILVEGEAEQYLVPKIAELHGVALDALGISVCPVWGTHFTSYVKLLNALGTPFAVITDGDPYVDKSDDVEYSAGLTRVSALLDQLEGLGTSDALGDNWEEEARSLGLFAGDTTFELDLLRSGRVAEMCQALKALATSNAAGGRADAWARALNVADEERCLKDINEIGKGRYAQRLASFLGVATRNNVKVEQGPAYVLAAIDYVVAACRSQ